MSSPKTSTAGGRPHRRMLAEYYGGNEDPSQAPKGRQSGVMTSKPANQSTSKTPISSVADDRNPYNLDGASFEAEMYTQKLIKEASLSQLMSKESEITKQIGQF